MAVKVEDAETVKEEERDEVAVKETRNSTYCTPDDMSARDMLLVQSELRQQLESLNCLYCLRREEVAKSRDVILDTKPFTCEERPPALASARSIPLDHGSPPSALELEARAPAAPRRLTR
jgi:hypothetical protein